MALTPFSQKTFTDVPEDSWFYKYVSDLATRGIIAGYSDGTFKPGNNVNRAEIAKLLYVLDEKIQSTFFERLGGLDAKVRLLEGKVGYIGKDVTYPGACYINGSWYSVGEEAPGGCSCESEDGYYLCD